MAFASEPTPVNNDLFALAIDPTDENKVYTTGKSVYRTTDGGATWTKDASQAFNIEALGVDPVNPANLYGASSSSAFVSHDSAQTWTCMYLWQCLRFEETRYGFGSEESVYYASLTIFNV